MNNILYRLMIFMRRYYVLYNIYQVGLKSISKQKIVADLDWETIGSYNPNARSLAIGYAAYA